MVKCGVDAPCGGVFSTTGKHMKKTSGLVALVVLVAGAYSASAWYMGKQAQQTIETAVANANTRLASSLGSGPNDLLTRLRIDRYERGIFRSVADYSLEVRDTDGQTIELRLQDTLEHGPFPWSSVRQGSFEPLLALSQARLIESPSTRAWVQSQKTGQSPLNIQTRVAFGGKGESAWVFSPVTISSTDGVVAFSGGTLDVQFSNTLNDSTAQARFDSFVLSGREPGENLGITGITLNADSATDPAGAVVTQSTLSVQQLVADDPELDGDIVIGNTQVNFNGRQNGNLVTGDVRYDFGSVKVGSINLGSMSATAGVEQFDIAALSALLADYDAIVARQGNVADPAQLDPADQKLLNQRLLAVLASKPVVRLDPVVWKNTKGESRAGLSVNLQPPVAADSSDFDTLLLQSLGKAQLDVSLSRAMLVQAAAQMQADPQEASQVEDFMGTLFDQYMARLQEVGLVTVKGDLAQLSITYNDQQVQVNGRSMPVEQFMQMMFTVFLML
jgi:uncharacterized protein YdgA (DUF945 family)